MARDLDSPPVAQATGGRDLAPPPGSDIDEASAGPVSGATPAVPLDAVGTTELHWAKHGLQELGGKGIAALEALRDVHADKTGQATFGDAYNRNLAFLDKTEEASDAAHPVARWVGNALGAANGAAMLAPFAPASGASLLAKVGQGAKIGAAVGAMGGFGASRANDAGRALVDTGLGAGLGAATGAAAPVVAKGLGMAGEYVGGKLKDLGAWLKVHSLHPTPKLAEAMADLPGGELGVGKELLERGIGGLTNRGTANQVNSALDDASKVAMDLARAHDASGAQGLSLRDALDAGLQKAADLHAEPTTRPAGEKLANLLAEYENMYGNRQVPAAEALAFKRALGREAYGMSKVLEKTGDKVSGDYGSGVARLERAVDNALDRQLGPKFEDANLTVRRLMGANQAAERMAARSQANHIIGLIPTVAGGTLGAVHGGTPEAAMAMLGTAALQKYGSQVGARGAYELGNILQGGLPEWLAPELAAPAAESSLPTMLRLQAQPAMADRDSSDSKAMIAALRRRSQ